MATYTFDESVVSSTFKGKNFYSIHQHDIFLTDPKTVESILCQGKKIRAQLKQLQPGQQLIIGTALVSAQNPLFIIKGGGNVEISDADYTLNRLTGMCAAYASSINSVSYKPKCAMAIALGLDMDRDRKLYYSAAPGAEHFTEQFSYLPLLCAIKQLEMGKVAKENITRIASVKNENNKTLADILSDTPVADVSARLNKFGTGGTRGVMELEKALAFVKRLKSTPSTS